MYKLSLYDEPFMLQYIERLLANEQADVRERGAKLTLLRYAPNNNNNTAKLHMSLRVGTELFRLRSNLTVYGAYITVYTETFKMRSTENGGITYDCTAQLYQDITERRCRDVLEAVQTAITQCVLATDYELREASCLVY